MDESGGQPRLGKPGKALSVVLAIRASYLKTDTPDSPAETALITDVHAVNRFLGVHDNRTDADSTFPRTEIFH